MKRVFLIALVCFAYTEAVPVSAEQADIIGNFVPEIPNSFEVLEPEQAQTVSTSDDPVQAAIDFFASNANVPTQSIAVSSSHKSEHNGVTHVYLQQIINGLEVSNGVGNVNVGKNGQILSVGNSFYGGPIPEQTTDSQPKFSAKDAVAALGEFLNLQNTQELTQVASVNSDGSPGFTVSGASFAVEDIPAVLKYIQVTGGDELNQVWSLECKTQDNMYNAFIETNEGEVVGLVDWVAHASYNVFPFGIIDPESGSRSIVKNPARKEASPFGWHSQGAKKNFTKTIGNNVYAQENHEGKENFLNNYRPDGGAALKFDHPLSLKLEPQKYVDAALTNLFYLNNIIHDLFYLYGFTEKAGNFQENNFGKGGAQLDAVIAQGQDGSKLNNAVFSTPPDGRKGMMKMYLWNKTSPKRDGDLDSGIVIHEYTHGISNRLTGGPMNVNCLASGEAGGMGEGWGDIFATITRVKASTTRKQDYVMGKYVFGSGIRKFPYSTSMVTNPSTYKLVLQPAYKGAHAKGEVWAVMLYEVFWNLVEKNKFEPNWFNSKSKAGNIQMIQLIIDGMKLQPCNPNFVQARDAILQADKNNYKGANQCAIWKGFAKRGLGKGARSPGVESVKLPVEC